MMPRHAKMPSVLKKTAEMCAHGGPVHCNAGCYAEGGEVNDRKQRVNNERGVHKSYMPLANEHGESIAGNQWREGDSTSRHLSKEKHRKRLEELKGMPNPKLYAEGGEVEHDEPDGDEDLGHMVAKELMDAIGRKDHKGISEAMEAMVMHHMSKGEK